VDEARGRRRLHYVADFLARGANFAGLAVVADNFVLVFVAREPPRAVRVGDVAYAAGRRRAPDEQLPDFRVAEYDVDPSPLVHGLTEMIYLFQLSPAVHTRDSMASHRFAKELPQCGWV
jgi:hypothetical protein